RAHRLSRHRAPWRQCAAARLRARHLGPAARAAHGLEHGAGRGRHLPDHQKYCGRVRLGAFLMKVVYHGDLVVSAMFVTAMAANALLVELARQTAGVRITWTQWAWAALAPGLVGLALVPYAVYRLCPPEVQDTDEARKIARLRIIEMGPLGRAEKLMLAVFVPVLLLWVTEGWHGR